MTDRLIAGPFDLIAGIAAFPHRHPIIARMTAFVGIVLVWMLLSVAAHAAGCSNMQRLAQEHSNDMARRGSLDHRGFSDRGRRGARAENVALASSKAQAMRLWHASPPHAANMRLPGCKAVASRGRYYTMEIGQ